MSDERGGRIGLADAMWLIAAAGVGLWGTRHSWLVARVVLIARGGRILQGLSALWQSDYPMYYVVRDVTIPVPLLASMSVAMLGMILAKRPSMRGLSIAGRSAIASSSTGIVAVLLAFLLVPRWNRNIVTAPVPGLAWTYGINFLWWICVAAGGAVASTWTVVAASRRWRAEPTLRDRSARALGVWWIVVALLSLATSQVRWSLLSAIRFSDGW